MQTQLLTKRAFVGLTSGLTLSPISIRPAAALQKRSLYFAGLVTNGGAHWGEWRLELLLDGALIQRFRIGFGNTLETFGGRTPDWSDPSPSETGHYRSDYTGGPAFMVLEQSGMSSTSRPQSLPASADALAFSTGCWETNPAGLTWIQYQVHCLPFTWQARIDEVRLSLARFTTDIVASPYPYAEVFFGCKSEGADAPHQSYLPGGQKL